MTNPSEAARALLSRLTVPVVAAPMFLVSGPDLVIAAGRAGIIGAFPTQNCRTVDELDRWFAEITAALTVDGECLPWAVNLITHRTNARLAEDLALVERYRPPVVITALGSPVPVLDAVHAYGGIVIADVADLTMARKAAAAGADGLACISVGAGGHTGSLSPFAFTAEVRSFFDGLLVIGGGISDGRGVAGAVAAGADLVYMGTRFLPAAESMAVPEYKAMVVDSGPADLIVSAGITGTPASWLRPSLVANGIDPDALGEAAPDRNYQAGDSAVRRWKDLWAAGQGLGVVDAVTSVDEIVDALATDYLGALERLTSLPVKASPIHV
ncbi:nitronate monooxygenase [Gordonia sp. (in: high G+C Gram-positive bacteria)]|uniref:NAD(P)H-dependent flavin oxidoreductase n=1 Tax=Gordonia sp. (in: high G+C Gram-positive bacteria) TaxID=84139 RepID=UPI00169F1F26|nr:nitronate monooxygenase [Gordonia sp. (in: high G+C Gram-positive bacteria)]NLG46237.1 nitronate monooxygenase [Gordonia sp. (in: high G+C Gram-positive bacteria)]